jgi:hypothetical protein
LNPAVPPAIMDGVKPGLPEKTRRQWVLLTFRLPREPSTPRIAVWRKLKALGAAQLLDGLVALPLGSRNREQLEWLAGEVTETGGEAAIWIGRLASAAGERELVARMQEAIAAQYRSLIDEAASVRAQPPARQRRSLARLRRELRRIRQRDYFPPRERELAQRAVDELAADIDQVPA